MGRAGVLCTRHDGPRYPDSAKNIGGIGKTSVASPSRIV